jgi:sporulation protein YqfC
MRKRKLFEQTKDHMADALKLPKDLAKGEALISITGQEEVFVENYKGILECTASCIIVATGRCRIQFLGQGLCVEYYTDEEMKIEGLIQKIIFL